MSRSGLSAEQISRDPLLQMLCEVLVEVERARRGAVRGIDSVPLRACAALYQLLREHQVDQRGRCRSCRRPGLVFRSRWQPCQVRSNATVCLRQLDEILLFSPLVRELGLAAVAPPPTRHTRAGARLGRAPAPARDS
ncbi:MAG: hypothetical protein WCF33_07585 [Pseudonocardiaceae bacterium]